MSPTDLGELLSAFNDVTAKLQKSHEKLHGEVARLTRELADANATIERSRRLAALGEMAAGIAHEVRNPLGSIRLYARILEQDLPLESETRGTALKIATSVTAIERIVGDVLSFAREHRVQRVPVDALELIERSIEACAPQGHPAWRGIAIERPGSAISSRTPGRAIELEADAGLLQQALVNVIRNAFEAMEDCAPPADGHRLTIEIEERQEVAGRREAAVAFIVRDTGPGVSEETISRMFNPFFTTRSAGTGLGLSIVHRIADAHSGVVRVRNNRHLAGELVTNPVGARASEREGEAHRPGAAVEIVLPKAGNGSEAVVGAAVREALTRAEGVRASA